MPPRPRAHKTTYFLRNMRLCDIHHYMGANGLCSSCDPTVAERKGEIMYIVALFIVMAILLEAVMKVLRSILDLAQVGGAVAKIPVVGANLTLLISILMVWLLGDWGHLLSGWGWVHDDEWINVVANGAIIAGMIPLKDAVFSAIGKGLRA